MSYLQRQYNQVCIVNYMIKLRCSVHEVFKKKFFNFRLNSWGRRLVKLFLLSNVATVA